MKKDRLTTNGKAIIHRIRTETTWLVGIGILAWILSYLEYQVKISSIGRDIITAIVVDWEDWMPSP